jgi:peroxiredoxin
MMLTQSRFVSIGSEAPDFTLPSVTDEEVRLSDYRDQKHVVLVFPRGFF